MLIDEYDHFVNELTFTDPNAYTILYIHVRYIKDDMD